MQEAGRILLMPKGDYSASATYEMLDLVNHSGASWVCKKNCTGQTPSDSNTEFWQRFGTAVDLSNYLSKSGGAINGNVKVYTPDDTYRVFTLENGTRTLEFALYAGGAFRIYDITNNKVILLSTVNGTNTIDATASGNLPLTGGTINGNLLAHSSEAVQRFLLVTNALRQCNMQVTPDGRFLLYDNTNAKNIIQSTADGTNTFNGTLSTKPTGTYTGNGDATARTINTSGVGHTLLVWNQDNAILITPSGAFGKKGTSFVALNNSNAKFAEGVLTLSTDDSALNYNGYTYYYQVL